MKSTSILVGTLLLGGITAYAQEGTETPKVEVGLNYSYTRINPGGTFSSYNANGGFADVAYNFNRYFGVVADLGGSYTGTANGLALNNTTFEYLFGPRFSWRHSRFTPNNACAYGGQRFSNGFNPTSSDPRLGTSQQLCRGVRRRARHRGIAPSCSPAGSGRVSDESSGAWIVQPAIYAE